MNRQLAAEPIPTANSKPRVGRIMLLVLLALLPGTALYAVLVNPMVVVNVIVAVVFACFAEAIALRLRSQPVKTTLQDISMCVAAWLLALAVPPQLPLSQLLVGVLAMVWLGKHVFGGLGQNIFNPAMVGYAVLLLSFPASMTFWLAPETVERASLQQLLQAKWAVGSSDFNPVGSLAGGNTSTDTPQKNSLNPSRSEHIESHWDALTRPTLLDRLRTEERVSGESATVASETLRDDSLSINATAGRPAAGRPAAGGQAASGTEVSGPEAGRTQSGGSPMDGSRMDAILSSATPSPRPQLGATPSPPPQPGATPQDIRVNGLTWQPQWSVSLAFLAGGLLLLSCRVIRWHIPISMLVTLGCLHLLHGWIATDVQLTAWQSLLSGAAILGAFFIATDPVSSATSRPGQWVFGAGIGAITFVLREFSAYPEGVAFAVLIMNAAVPAIDGYFNTSRLIKPRAGRIND